MRLKPIYGKYYQFTKYKGDFYKLVFDHDQRITKCFQNEEEATHNIQAGTFSLLDELNQSFYVMNDNLRHFILEYPLLSVINVFKQKYSPLDNLETPNILTATNFEANLTELPAYDWGGLVKTTIGYGKEIYSFIDGNPGVRTYFYAIGLYCSPLNRYINDGLPSNDNGHLTKQVRLWARVPYTPDMITCKIIIQYRPYINLLLTIFIFSLTD